MEKQQQEKKDSEPQKSKSSKVDTKRLEYFSDVDQYKPLLKHPVLSSFLELEQNDLNFRFRMQFFLYLIYVIVIFLYFGERFTSINDHFGKSLKFVVYEIPYQDINYELTVVGIITMALTLFFIISELIQFCKLKNRYRIIIEVLIIITDFHLKIFSQL